MGASQSVCCCSASSSKHLDDFDDKDWKCADIVAHDYSSQPPSRQQMRPQPVSGTLSTDKIVLQDGHKKLRKQQTSSDRSQQEPWIPALTRTPSRAVSLDILRPSMDRDRAARLAELKAAPPLAFRPPRASSLSRSRSHGRPGTAPSASAPHHDQAEEYTVRSRPRRSRTLHSRRVSTPVEFHLSPTIKDRMDIETTTRQVHAAAAAELPPRSSSSTPRLAAPSATSSQPELAELPASATCTTAPTVDKNLALPTRPWATLRTGTGTTMDNTTVSVSLPTLNTTTVSTVTGSIALPPAAPLPNPPRKKSTTARPNHEPTLPSIDALTMTLPAYSPLEAVSHTFTASPTRKTDFATREATRQRLLDQQHRAATPAAPPPSPIPTVAARDIPIKITPLYTNTSTNAAAASASATTNANTKARTRDTEDLDAASLSTSTSSTRSSLSLPQSGTTASPVPSLSAFPPTPVTQPYSLFPRAAKPLAHVPSWMDLGRDVQVPLDADADAAVAPCKTQPLPLPLPLPRPSTNVAQRGKGVIVDHKLRHMGLLLLGEEQRGRGRARV